MTNSDHLPLLVTIWSILDGYFNPLVFWYQWEHLRTRKEFIFLCRVSKIGNGIAYFPNFGSTHTIFIAEGFGFDDLLGWIVACSNASLPLLGIPN